jgi:hypothetical protein
MQRLAMVAALCVLGTVLLSARSLHLVLENASLESFELQTELRKRAQDCVRERERTADCKRICAANLTALQTLADHQVGIERGALQRCQAQIEQHRREKAEKELASHDPSKPEFNPSKSFWFERRARQAAEKRATEQGRLVSALKQQLSVLKQQLGEAEADARISHLTGTSKPIVTNDVQAPVNLAKAPVNLASDLL